MHARAGCGIRRKSRPNRLQIIYGSYYTDELAQVIDNQNGTTSFGYDAQGNLAGRNGVSYTFDVGNRLRNVAGEEGGYAYDGWGRRVAQTDASGTIYSFYDLGGQLIYQRDRAGGTHDFLYLGGKLMAIRDYDTGGIARVWRFQDTDALGSVIRQTDKYGNDYPNTAVVYDAWGGMHGATPQDGPGYTSQVEDADTNLVYMQQRYYDPSVGRFLSMDPVDASGTDGSNLDRYWYAKDNPYRYTDPDGRKCSTMDGKASCTFDEFKDKNGKTISRKQALSSGSKLAKFFHADMGSHILRAEANMTAKYSDAKDLAAKGGDVTIKGNEKLGIPDQKISASVIVNRMETIRTIASAQAGGASIAGTPAGIGGAPSGGPITFYEDGAKSSNLPQTFGHEILHTIYSGVGVKDNGWANPANNEQHQIPFNDASDEIH